MALTRDTRPPKVRLALGLTHLGLWAEALATAFWPLWAVLSAGVGLWLLGAVPEAWEAPALMAWGACLAGALAWGALRLRRPRTIDAEARVDAHLPGRPFAALRDAQALGRDDPASEAVWHHHQRRMARRTHGARAIGPAPRLARHDPNGLHILGTVVLVLGLVFGTARAPIPQIEPGTTATSGPSWEAWAEPPRYTGRPGLYLNDAPAGALSLPQGTVFTVRFYGDDTPHAVSQDISDDTPITLMRSGRFAIDGPGGRAWDVTAEADFPPEVTITDTPYAERGEAQVPFRATDDFGVRRGQAQIALDLDRVDRRHGLRIAPDPRAPETLTLPMPLTRDRSDIETRLREDLSTHAFANLPVVLTLNVFDDAGLSGASDPQHIILPGKRFFEPTAKAIAEQRRDFLWARANARRIAQILRAIAWKSEEEWRKPEHAAALRSLITRIEDQIPTGFADAAEYDAIAQGLWVLALELEEGSLENARERLKRAQERLSEAMRNGASEQEIAELMEELRAAKDDYMRLLAEQAEPAEGGADTPDTGDDTRTITDAEIDELMAEIQRLMKEGRMDEARILMDQLNALLENLTLREGGEGGDGPSSPGGKSMQDLRDTLRDQQELSDDAFRALQDQFNNRADEGTPSGEDLADRQGDLGDDLERLRRDVPGMTGEDADRMRDALERGARAMERADELMRDGDLFNGIEQQGRAMEALREGMSALSDAMRGEDTDQQTEGGEAREGTGNGQPTRDPMGRGTGEGGMAGGGGVPSPEADAGRARDLMDALRDRLGDRERPEQERDYLERLLDRY